MVDRGKSNYSVLSITDGNDIRSPEGKGRLVIHLNLQKWPE